MDLDKDSTTLVPSLISLKDLIIGAAGTFAAFSREPLITLASIFFNPGAGLFCFEIFDASIELICCADPFTIDETGLRNWGAASFAASGKEIF